MIYDFKTPLSRCFIFFMIIYDCLKCCLVVRNLGDGFFLRIFMQHYEYKTLSKCRAFIFCTKNTPEKRGCSVAGAVAKLVSCCQDLPGYFLILSHFAIEKDLFDIDQSVRLMTYSWDP